jgi:hypothetical protein
MSLDIHVELARRPSVEKGINRQNNQPVSERSYLRQSFKQRNRKHEGWNEQAREQCAAPGSMRIFERVFHNMLKELSRAAILIIITAVLVLVEFEVRSGPSIGLAEGGELARTDSAAVSQPSALISATDAQQHRFAKSESIAARHFEPLWLLVLGAALLAIGTSINRIARTEVKNPLAERKSGRTL